MERVAVRRTLELGCPVSTLWRLVTDERELAGWLGQDVVLDLRPGGHGRVVDDGGSARELVVREVEPDHRVAFAWWPEDDERAVSEVVFAVETTGTGSRLLVTETASAMATASATSWDIRLISLWLAICSLAADRKV